MTDQTRADFEAHFGLTTRQAWQHPDGSYKFPEVQAKWEGYFAGVAKAAPQLYIDALTAARDFLASGKRDGEARLAVLCQVGTALTAAKVAPVAAAAPAAVPDDAKDAARYRHIVTTMATYGVPFNPPKQHGIEFSPLPLVTPVGADRFWTEEPSKEEVDAAIDADMRTE